MMRWQNSSISLAPVSECPRVSVPKIRCLVIFLVVTAISPVMAGTPTKKTGQEGFDGARTEIYKEVGDVKLAIHIFEPEGHKPTDRTPAIVFFFGGGWRSGSPKQFEEQCRYLASRGMVAATADYRVSSRHQAKVRDCVEDAKSAVRWLRQNAERLGIDPQRIAAGGGSAGGHLAACTAVVKEFDAPTEDASISSVPNALVLFNPVGATAPFEGSPDEFFILERSLGAPAESLSPAHCVSAGAPPAIMFFGEDDKYLGGGRRFHEEARKAGNRNDLVTYPGYDHGFFNFRAAKPEPFIATLTGADEFLYELGYLSGKPRVAEWLADH